MRKLIPGIAGMLAMTFLLVLTFGAGPTKGTATISGTVKDEKGNVLDGVLVRLINTDRQVSVSVITQGGGRFSADSLFPGTYDVRAERRGYATAVKSGMRVDNRGAADLTVQKQEGKADRLAVAELAGQFPADPNRELVFETCFQCHSMMVTAYARKDRAGWDQTIRRMTEAPAVNLETPTRRKKEEEIQRLVNYFSKYFNTDRPLPPPLATEPEPPRENANIRITEYKIPTEGAPPGPQSPSEYDYSGRSMHAALLPHNITITPEGIVWFAQNRGNRIGRLDPATGEFKSYEVPTPRSGPHGVNWAVDGSIWFTEGLGNKVGRLDPTTGEIREIPIGCGGNSIVKDSKGMMYVSCGITNQIVEVNSKTFAVKFYKAPPNSGPYGIVVDQKDRVWWCGFRGDTIGMLDPATGKITEYSPPSKLSAPRRLAVDKKGNIWFGEWRTSNLGKLDPATGKITEYPMPTPNSDPYEVMVDADDTVWAAGFQSNTLAHLDPATGKFVEYPIPTPETQIRKMVTDLSQGVWFAESNTDTIGHIFVKK